MRGYLRTFTLMIAFVGLFVAVGYAIALAMGAPPRAMMILFLTTSVIINVAMFFWSDRIVLRSYRARIVGPADAPRLTGIVDRLALAARMPRPRVAIIPSMTPNAFATGRSPRHAVVAATTGILQLLDDDELEGVLAHELSHVHNRDTLIMTVAAVLSSAIAFAAYSALFTRSREGNPLLGILVFLTAPLAATLLRLAISRNREFAADASGAAVCGKPWALARALQKLEHGVQAYPMREANPSTSSLFIVNPLRGSRASRLFATHPPTHERVERLTSGRVL